VLNMRASSLEQITDVSLLLFSVVRDHEACISFPAAAEIG
jgi:hypothetical protein